MVFGLIADAADALGGVSLLEGKTRSDLTMTQVANAGIICSAMHEAKFTAAETDAVVRCMFLPADEVQFSEMFMIFNRFTVHHLLSPELTGLDLGRSIPPSDMLRMHRWAVFVRLRPGLDQQTFSEVMKLLGGGRTAELWTTLWPGLALTEGMLTKQEFTNVIKSARLDTFFYDEDHTKEETPGGGPQFDLPYRLQKFTNASPKDDDYTREHQNTFLAQAQTATKKMGDAIGYEAKMKVRQLLADDLETEIMMLSALDTKGLYEIKAEIRRIQSLLGGVVEHRRTAVHHPCI
jgi:hypothetical protein